VPKVKDGTPAESTAVVSAVDDGCAKLSTACVAQGLLGETLLAGIVACK
jgi:hypothetical protein